MTGSMFRAPAKKYNDTDSDNHTPMMLELETVGSSQNSSVRRSIEGWELGKHDGQRKQSPSVKKDQHKPKLNTTFSQENRSSQPRRPSVEASGTTPKLFASRIDEGKALNNKAKMHLASSKNLKTDIKDEVTKAVERLYQLVKEAEAELTKEPAAKKLEKNQLRGKEKRTMSQEPGVDKIPERDDGRILAKIEQNAQLLRENVGKIDELRKIMDQQNEMMQRATYATVATASPTVGHHPERSVLHSVVVSSANEEETGEEVLEKVRRAVDAREGWVQVERVRKAKDRKVIMGCRTKEERNKIKERLETAGEQLVIEEVRNKDPLLILRDVLAVHSDEEILKALRNQNRGVFRGLEDKEARVSVKYRKKARNPLNGHIILSVSPAIWQRAVDAKRLRIDLQQVHVEDQSPLVQCTRCLGYGHGRRFCKEPADLCSHYGGPHLKAECPENQIGETPTCRNCVQAKILKSGHNAFSSECPVRKKWDALALLSVAYC